MTTRQRQIISELRCRTEPIQAYALAPLVGCTMRRVREDIDELQRSGYKVLSGYHGYWLARTEEDAKLCRVAAKTRMAHAISELRDAKRFERWAAELESKQETIEGVTG